MKFTRILITGLLVVSALSVFATPVFAANENFGFSLRNTEKRFNVCTWHYNEKWYEKNDATVKTTSNDAPGYGAAFIMMHKYTDLNGNEIYERDTYEKPACWISGIDTKHPKYLPGHAITYRKYYVAARMDDDYYGYYSCYGKFNSDYTEPKY